MKQSTPQEEFDEDVRRIRDGYTGGTIDAALELAKKHGFPLESLERAVESREDYTPCSDDFEESLRIYSKVKSLRLWSDWHIHLEEPLDEETKQDLIRRFDECNYPWGYDGPKPSEEAETLKDGTYCLVGSDSTEGKIRRYMGILGNGKGILVHKDMAQDVEEILTEHGLEFQMKNNR